MKDDWILKFHEFSRFQLDLFTEMEKHNFPKDFFDEKGFSNSLITIFNKFHHLFVLDEDDNSILLEPLMELNHLCSFITCESEKFSHEFYLNGSFNLIFHCILNSSKFSTENIVKEITDKRSDCSIKHRIDIYINYLIILSNIMRYNGPTVKTYVKNHGFREKLLNLIEILEKVEHEDIKNMCFNLKCISFVLFINFPLNDSNSHILLNQEIFNVFLNNLQKKFDKNPSYSGPFFILNDELIEYFIILSTNESNFVYLKEILPLIFQYTHHSWNENIQILAYTCIYVLISNKDCKEVLKENKELMKHLNSPQPKNNQQIKYLRRNILYELNIDNKEKSKNDLPVICSYHENDKNIVYKLCQFFEKTTSHRNILLLNSKCKKKKIIFNLNIQYENNFFLLYSNSHFNKRSIMEKI